MDSLGYGTRVGVVVVYLESSVLSVNGDSNIWSLDTFSLRVVAQIDKERDQGVLQNLPQWHEKSDSADMFEPQSVGSSSRRDAGSVCQKVLTPSSAHPETIDPNYSSHTLYQPHLSI